MAMAEAPPTSCEELFDPIMKILRNNDAESFSKYFADAVEIDFLGDDTIYSKVQAVQVVKTFFARKSIKQIILKHCSGNEYVKYAVTSITDLEGLLYRATIFMRIENNGNAVIQEIRMEKQE
jgi:hypothetical protein